MNNGWDNYVRTARDYGVPADQIRRFMNARIVLQPKQLRFAALARACDLPGGPEEIGYGGARGGGKTFVSFAQVAVDDCQRYPGLQCLMLRKVGKSNRENVRALAGQALRYVPHTYAETSGIIRFPNGSNIILGHYQTEGEIESYLGLSYDVILIEEATTLSHPKVAAIRTCLRTAKDGWRPRMYFTTNPGGVGHGWFKSTFVTPWKRGTETSTRFVPATVEDNQFLNPEYAAKLGALTGWQLRAWRHGDWEIGAGTFFSTFREGVHVIAPLPLSDIAEWRFYGGLDYGFTHYTASHLVAVSPDGVRHVIAEYGDRKRLPSYHASRILEMLASRGNPDVRKFAAGTDVFGGEGRIAREYAALGVPLAKAITDRVAGASEILRLLGDPSERIDPQLYVWDTCIRLAEQLGTMVHDEHRPEDVDKVDCDDEGRGGDDFYDSARYALMAASAKRVELTAY